MSDLNVDDFCKDVARSLCALYAAFPRPTAIFVSDIAGDFEPDEFGVPHKRHQACLSTLLWLGEEGYVRHSGTIRQDAVDQAVLTARAFSQLTTPPPDAREPAGDMPESVQWERSTRVEALRRILKERDSAALKRAVLELVAAMLAR